MANFFVVFNEQLEGSRLPVGTEFESSKTLDYPKVARVLKVEAASVAAAQTLVMHTLAGEVTGTPVVVTEAQWKES